MCYDRPTRAYMGQPIFHFGASVIARPHSRSKGGLYGGYHIEMNWTPETGYSCITSWLVSDLHTVTVVVDKKTPGATSMGSPGRCLAKQRRAEIDELSLHREPMYKQAYRGEMRMFQRKLPLEHGSRCTANAKYPTP